MSAHTPGPWAIHHNDKPLFGYWHIRQDPKDWDGMGYQAICTLPADKKGTHYGEMFHANARLIASAPAMLEALKIIADWDKAPLTHEHPGPLLDVIRCICDRAREEIRKATGP